MGTINVISPCISAGATFGVPCPPLYTDTDYSTTMEYTAYSPSSKIPMMGKNHSIWSPGLVELRSNEASYHLKMYYLTASHECGIQTTSLDEWKLVSHLSTVRGPL